MLSSLKSFFRDYWLVAVILTVYLYFQFPFLHLDLWNDEIYTLKYFTIVSPLKTVLDYHSTNNHILFNLINNVYLRIIGEKSVYAVMDHPWVLRIVSLLYSLGTIFFTYGICRKILGKNAALFSVIFLCTAVPFLNFAAQVRGYSLSMFLLTAMTHCIFSYDERHKNIFLYGIGLLAAMSAYTIPLNFYALTGVFIFLLIRLIKKNNPQRHHDVRVVVALLSGIVLALILYSPLVKKVFFNEVVMRDENFTFLKWREMTKNVFIYFFSYRYGLLPFVVIGFGAGIYQLMCKKNKTGAAFALYLLIVLLVPLLMSLIRRDALIDRTFVNLVPLFVMLMAWTVFNLRFTINDLRFARKWTLNGRVIIIGIAVYCFANLSFELKRVSDYLLHDIETSMRSHTIYYNYYLCHYRPMKVTGDFKKKNYSENSVVAIHDSEPYDLPEYLDKYDIPVSDFSILDFMLEEGQSVFVVTRHPKEIDNDDFRKGHCCRIKLVSDGVSYYNVFELTPDEELKLGY